MADKKYRVACASTDGKNVDTHYGRAERFFIYDVDDDEGFDFAEERIVKPVCHDGGHIIAQMDQSTKNFTDCKYVVASRIGSGAASSLTSAGITAMELPGTIEEAIYKIWKYNQVSSLGLELL